MRTAFKEWAIVVDSLGRGEQIIILRKGGISEGRGGFQVEHPRFLLFSTLYHQQRESVIPSAQSRYDIIAPQLPPPDTLRFEYWTEVVSWRKIENLEAAERLRGQHIWRDEIIADRYDWGRNKGIFALAVRVHRLPRPVDHPMQESYGGCKSWIELDADIATEGSAPVLDDEAFASKLKKLEFALDLVS